jgi:chaperonin GroEL
MAVNAGVSPDIVIEKILAESNDAMGWDFRESEMIDLMKFGIIDPVKVTRSALRNAASCAGTLITTNFGIIQTGDID